MFVVYEKEGEKERRFNSFSEAIKDFIKRMERGKHEHYIFFMRKGKRLYLKAWKSGYEVISIKKKRTVIGRGTDWKEGLGLFVVEVAKRRGEKR